MEFDVEKRRTRQAVTMKDVARKAGVSQPTVSRIINDRDGSFSIRQVTREKVWSAVKELNYVQNVTARSLVTQKTHNIGLLFFKSSNILSNDFFYSRVFYGVEEEIAKENYRLIVSCVDQGRSEIPKLIRERFVDGIVIVGTVDRTWLSSLPHDVPFAAMVDWVPEDDSEIHVATDNYAGAVDLTQHLVSLGHKRLGFLGATVPTLSVDERVRGFHNVLYRHKIPLREEHIVRCRHFASHEEVYAAMELLLNLPQRPTAVLCVNDVYASSAIRCAKNYGLRIPEDISITGFDDMDLAVHLDPPLTTVRSFREELGRIAVRELISMIETGETRKRTYLIKPTLIVRASSGPAPGVESITT